MRMLEHCTSTYLVNFHTKFKVLYLILFRVLYTCVRSHLWEFSSSIWHHSAFAKYVHPSWKELVIWYVYVRTYIEYLQLISNINLCAWGGIKESLWRLLSHLQYVSLEPFARTWLQTLWISSDKPNGKHVHKWMHHFLFLFFKSG